MRRSRRCGSGCSGCDQPLGLSWSGLPAPGEGRGSRPSIDPRAPALVARWILGTSPRMTTRSQAPQGSSSLVDGDGVADGVERGGFRPGAVVDGADAPQAGGALRAQVVEPGERAVLAH